MRKIALTVILLIAALGSACEGESVEPVATKQAVISEDLGNGMRVGMSSKSLPGEAVSISGHQLQGPRTRQLKAENTEATVWGSEQLLLAVRSNEGEVQEVTLTSPDPGKLDSNFIETKSGLKLGKSLRAEAHRKLGEPDWTLEREDNYQERWIQIDRDSGLVYQLTLTFSKYNPTDRTLEQTGSASEDDAEADGGANGATGGGNSTAQPSENGQPSAEDPPESENGRSGSGRTPAGEGGDSTTRNGRDSGDGDSESGSEGSDEEDGDGESSTETGQPEKSSWILTSYGYARHRSVSIAEMYLKQGKGEGGGEVTVPGEQTRQKFRERIKQRSESDT